MIELLCAADDAMVFLLNVGIIAVSLAAAAALFAGAWWLWGQR